MSLPTSEREVRLLDMLADDCEAWATDAKDWMRFRRYFEAQPDADTAEGKELIAAIEGRIGAIRTRLIVVQGLLRATRASMSDSRLRATLRGLFGVVPPQEPRNG